MRKINIKYPCGFCQNNVTKTAKAVQCSKCNKWYHFKCTDLTASDYEKLKVSKKSWDCNSCTTAVLNLVGKIDGSVENLDMTVDDLNKILEEQLVQNDTLVNSLNEDLVKMNEQVNKLREEKNALQNLLIQKEEIIIKLEEKIRNCEINENEYLSYSTVAKLNLTRQNVSLKNKNSSQIRSLSQSTPKAAAVTKKHNKNLSPIVKATNPTFVSENPFQILSTIIDDSPHPKKLQPATQSKKKILLCADSHGRDLAKHLNDLQKSFDAVGFVKPAGHSKDVLNMDNVKGELMKKDDCLVLITGTNDVACNEAQACLSSMENMLQNLDEEMKVVVVDLPKRCDLPDWSCVNVETRKTNNALKELCSKYFNVFLVEASGAERIFHTKHGMHLNHRGKRWLAENILTQLEIACKYGKEEEAATTADDAGSSAGNDQRTRKSTTP